MGSMGRAFELDPDFDYDNCKLTPKPDMDLLAKEWARTGRLGR